MELVDITKIMYLDVSTAVPDLFELFGFAMAGGSGLAIMFHLASSAVFGLIGLLDIKDK